MGLLVKPGELGVTGCVEGEDLAERLGITKYVPPEPKPYKQGGGGGDVEAGVPDGAPRYTDLESLRRWPDVFRPGEEVISTEKIHGACWRAVWSGGRFWVGSHRQWKQEDPRSVRWRAADRYGLADKLEALPGVVVFGEVFGAVQDLHYGVGPGGGYLRLFY